jgi:trimethylguanosine synthase
MNNDAHPQDPCPYGEHFQATWDLLTPLERSFRYDEYGLYALTPQYFSAPIIPKIRGRSVIDACCSLGGMAIALALAGRQVTAIELDAGRLALARENARIAGVVERITFLHGDTLALLPTLRAEAVFFDGQWAGPAADSDQPFRLADFRPDGNEFLSRAFALTGEVILRTPPHFDFAELDRVGRVYFREPTIIDGSVRAYSVYFA